VEGVSRNGLESIVKGHKEKNKQFDKMLHELKRKERKRQAFTALSDVSRVDTA